MDIPRERWGALKRPEKEGDSGVEEKANNTTEKTENKFAIIERKIDKSFWWQNMTGRWRALFE